MEQNQISLNQIYSILLEIRLKMQKMDQYLEDLEFARRTEEAYKRIEAGEYISVDSDNLSEEMQKW